MKWLLAFAIAFQIYMVTRCPAGLGSESILAAQALLHGQLPYRDFKMHVGPLPVLIYAALFSVPPLAWCAFVFVAANLTAAWGIYNLGLVDPKGKCDPIQQIRAERYPSAVIHTAPNSSHPTGRRQAYSILAASLYLICCPFFGGNEMYVESLMTAFGIWAFYFAETNSRGLAWLMVLLAVSTKQTGIFYLTALL